MTTNCRRIEPIAIDPNYAQAWALLAHAQQGLFIVAGRSGEARLAVAAAPTG